MMIGMGLFWVAVVLGFIWLVRDGTDHRQRPSEETPLTILDRRFAEGGVSLDDYHERRAVLTGAAPPRADQDITAEARERSQR